MNRNIRTRVFGISLEEASFERRGFPPARPDARRRLETIGRTFLTGYHAALENGSADRLRQRLDDVESELQGFAYEGAAMALGLMDMLLVWRRDRFRRYVEDPARDHRYMAYVGYGWALARLRRNPDRALAACDPLIRWLAVDGYGFHECYFHWNRVVNEQWVPRPVRGYAMRAFDQGVGRCLWFVFGADPDSVADAVGGFAAPRRADLWAGVGLAAAYAGIVDDAALQRVAELGTGYRPQISQGILFAAAARIEAGNVADHTERACRLLCGMSTVEAATLVDRERQNLSYTDALPAYELWRRRIASKFAEPSPVVTDRRASILTIDSRRA